MYSEFFRKNKLWLITIAVFLILITFLDSNNVLDKIQLNKEIKELKAQKKYYIKRISQDSTIIERLKDDVFLERYGRERYFMKKKGETIYIIKE